MLSSSEACAVSSLLLRHQGCCSFTQMALFDPVLASWYRSIVVQADNAMWLWWGEFDADDYLVAVVADERRSDHDRRAAYQIFLASNGLDPHFGERMRAHFLEHGVTALTVLLPENHWVVSFLLKFVEQGHLDTQDIERLHAVRLVFINCWAAVSLSPPDVDHHQPCSGRPFGRTQFVLQTHLQRRRKHEGITWERVASAACFSQIVEVARDTRTMFMDDAPSVAVEDIVEAPDEPRIANNAMVQFHHMVSARDAGLGLSILPASAGCCMVLVVGKSTFETLAVF